MRNPKMVIGSDRIELYSYLGKRKIYWGLQSRLLLNFALAITAGHFLLVGVPQLTSRFFGDKLGTVSKSLGAEDQSQVAEKFKQAKENIRQRNQQ